MTIEKYKEIVAYLKEILWKTDYYGHVFCVGGCVRDEIMGNEIKDIDLCLDVPNGGINFAEWMEKNGHTEGSVVVYPTYGTAMFRLKRYPDVELECVQTRKEQYKDKNSRNPETCYGSMREDCFRRDLTINSLYYDICNEKVLDITGNGISDIENHIIRVTSTPEIVFSDDPLRIMRVCRFSSRFGWEIENITYEGMKENAERILIITKERIQDELNKMLLGPRPVMAMELLREIGILKYIIPDIDKMYGLCQNKYHNLDVWGHSMKVLELVSERDFSLEMRLAALFHDVGKVVTQTISEEGNIHFYQHENASYELVETILTELKYPVRVIKDVQFLVKNHMITKNWEDDCSHMKLKSLRKLQYKCGDEETFEKLIVLIDCDNNAHAPEYCLPNQAKIIFDTTREMCKNDTAMFGYKLPINGKDIMDVKGIEPGKGVRQCIDYAMKLAYNNPLMTREEMLKHIKGYKL